MDTTSINSPIEDRIYKPSILECLVWIITSLSSGISLNFDPDVKGVFLDITLLEILLMFPSALLLLHGLKTAKKYCAIPWLACSLWNICVGQYLLLEEIVTTAYATYEKLPMIGCFVFFATLLTLVFRIILWGRTVHIAFFELKIGQKILPIEEQQESTIEFRKTEKKIIPIKYIEHLTEKFTEEASNNNQVLT